MRKRIQIRGGLVGSSDFTRVMSHRASLELNHKEFENSHLALMAKSITVESSSEPSPNTMVAFMYCGTVMKAEYHIVKSAGYKILY
jgi:hypothetical protein